MSAAWLIPDEEPTRCDGCPTGTYDADDWTQNHEGTWCPDCSKEVPA